MRAEHLAVLFIPSKKGQRKPRETAAYYAAEDFQLHRVGSAAVNTMLPNHCEQPVVVIGSTSANIRLLIFGKTAGYEV